MFVLKPKRHPLRSLVAQMYSGPDSNLSCFELRTFRFACSTSADEKLPHRPWARQGPPCDAFHRRRRANGVLEQQLRSHGVGPEMNPAQRHAEVSPVVVEASA